ncbi:MAG: hypothetical protein MI743_17540, partial [Sneathiellales bacterium]|nr:hypothetical protein [Sneathiellales bacterium]
GDAPKKILCLANKPLTTNRRFYRHTRTLASWGHDITVMALALPDPEFQIKNVTYRASEELYDWLRSEDLNKKQKIQNERVQNGLPLLDVNVNSVHNLQVFPKIFLLDAALRRLLPQPLFSILDRCYKLLQKKKMKGGI